MKIPHMNIITTSGKYLFVPRHNISTIELSAILAIAMNCSLHRDMDEYMRADENKALLRHFKFEKIEAKTVKRSIKHLSGIIEGKPIAVLGGGPSLPEDVKKLPKDCLKISINHHALKLGIDCAIMVFMDDPRKERYINSEWIEFVNNFKGTKITQIEGWSDFDLFGVDYWDGGMSGSLATWLACYMGSDPVILCGMDCFRGEITHCHEGPKSTRQHDYPIENHIGAWKPALLKCPNPERIRVMSGPLIGTFKQYFEGG